MGNKFSSYSCVASRCHTIFPMAKISSRQDGPIKPLLSSPPLSPAYFTKAKRGTHPSLYMMLHPEKTSDAPSVISFQYFCGIWLSADTRLLFWTYGPTPDSAIFFCATCENSTVKHTWSSVSKKKNLRRTRSIKGWCFLAFESYPKAAKVNSISSKEGNRNLILCLLSIEVEFFGEVFNDF